MLDRLRGLRAERIALIGAVVVALYYFMPGEDDALEGPAEVLDGDTLGIGERQVSLFAVDAPEHGQTCEHDGEPYPCGERATQALKAAIGQSAVRCKPAAKHLYGGAFARCFVGETDLGARMVAEGWAVAVPRFSDDYVEAEEKAAAAKVGLWRGTFETPEDWRHRTQ